MTTKEKMIGSVRVAGECSYDALTAALGQFIPKMQEGRQTIVVNVFRNRFVLGFHVLPGFVACGITSANCLSPIDNVCSRLYGDLSK